MQDQCMFMIFSEVVMDGEIIRLLQLFVVVVVVLLFFYTDSAFYFSLPTLEIK